MQHYPYILIGQGISGSVLSLQLKAAGIKHLLIDVPALSSSSKVAAGLVNPIVLKRLKKVQRVEEYLAAATPFYTKAEETLSTRFTYHQPLLHRFHNQEEQNHWLEKSEHPAFSPFLSDQIEKNSSIHIPAPFGLGRVLQSFWIDTPAFCIALARQTENILQYQLTPADVSLQNKTIRCAGETYSFNQLIDCSGHLARKLFPQLNQAFSPTRGEVLVIKAPELPENSILHAGVFILPLGNNLFKVGASYHWDILKDTPTEKGKDWLINELEKLYTGSYTIIQHLAGVRPNVKDRTPLVGELEKGLYCLNGMGSRAVLMAPYLAGILLNHLETNAPIPESFAPKRFT